MKARLFMKETAVEKMPLADVRFGKFAKDGFGHICFRRGRAGQEMRSYLY